MYKYYTFLNLFLHRCYKNIFNIKLIQSVNLFIIFHVYKDNINIINQILN